MDTPKHSLSFMLRNSGAVLRELQDQDVILERRDGPDLFVATTEREDAVRHGFDVAARTIAQVISNPALIDAGLVSFRAAIPWIEWLTPADQKMFAIEFARTMQACSDTGIFRPLSQMLNSWQKSAAIQNDPYLREQLTTDRGDDRAVLIDRP